MPVKIGNLTPYLLSTHYGSSRWLNIHIYPPPPPASLTSEKTFISFELASTFKLVFSGSPLILFPFLLILKKINDYHLICRKAGFRTSPREHAMIQQHWKYH